VRLPGAGLALATWILAAPIVGADAQTKSLVRGFVRTNDASGTWHLRLCRDSIERIVIDQTPGQSLSEAIGEVKRGMQDHRRAVFVEFDGSVAPDQVVAKRLWRVLGYPIDCANLPEKIPANTQVAASGNEPSWRLVVRGGMATFTRPDRETLVLAALRRGKPGPVRTFAESKGNVHLSVQVDEELCVDPLAEAGYGARITLTLRNPRQTESLKGCAARF